MRTRLAILAACFLGTAAYASYAMQPEQVVLRQPLSDLPYQMSTWQGQEAGPFSADVLQALGVDEYVNRIQREGDTIHSPLNCLPGAGWQIVTRARTSLPVADAAGPVVVNRFLIQKGTERQVVLYWYQSHGRVLASEYWSKVFLVYDAVRLNRSDAAMVRVISPVLGPDGTEAQAEWHASAFAETLFPYLEKFLPS
jgi:EpsI family protein